MATHRKNDSTSKSSQNGQENDYELEERAQLLSPTRQSTLTDSKSGLINDLPPLSYVESNNLTKAQMERPPILMHPHRRYSSQWWRDNWEDAVEARFWARVVYFSVAGLIMILWVVIMAAFAHENKVWNKDQVARWQGQPHWNRNGTTSGSSNSFAIGLNGALMNFDPVVRSLTVQWSGFYQSSDSNGTTPLAQDDSVLFPLVIYRDVSTRLHYLGNDTNATTAVYWQSDGITKFESPWTYQIDNVTTPPAGALGVRVWDNVNTEIDLGPVNPTGHVREQPLSGYPFDIWQGNVAFVAVDPYTMAEFGVNGTGVYPLAGAILSGNLLNWRFKIDPVATCNIDELQDAIKNGTLTPEITRLLPFTMAYKCDLEIIITAWRPMIVKFAATLAVIVNWTSTFFIFILTAESLILRRSYMLSGTDLLSVTFTALFALPTVRLLLPGAPDFGALNLVGIIPNVIIISLCITAIAIVKLRQDQKKMEREEKYE